MVIWNLWGIAGLMTAGFVAWLITFAQGWGAKELFPLFIFLVSLFGSVLDRVPAGRQLDTYLRFFKEPFAGNDDSGVRIVAFGVPLIAAPIGGFALGVGIPWLRSDLVVSEEYVRLMLMSCGASLAVGLAAWPLRAVRDLRGGKESAHEVQA